MQKDYRHEITLDRPVAEAFDLFTPRGEEGWVPGWAPTYVQPEDGETCEEMLFTTGEGDEATYWTCLKWAPADWHVRYLRMTPASRISFVDVRCRPEGDRTRVMVAYEMQALNDAGRAYMAELSDAAFAEMIDAWPRLIEDAA